jgi:insulysin
MINEPLGRHPLDKSEVRKLTLDNGVKAYLLSNPDFNVSAASMVVEVGSLENPDNREGLAHFLEHMLFLGTKKYPDVDEYSTYLKTFGGYSNAYTAGDHTNYQLQVLPDGFEGALDRFAQFFISPLFTAEYTAREVNAVNSEHQKNIMNDNWRQYRVTSQFVKKGHPARKFSTGSLETLGDITREELITFYNNQYSANRMGLALLSTHSLDEMEAWTRQYFSDVKNHNLERTKHDPIVFEKKEAFRLVQIDPVKDLRDLEISFAIPSTRHMYESKPGRQLGFILGHEGKGSLLSYLKDKGWAQRLSGGARPETKEYGMATIRIGLTPKGQKDYKEIVLATLDYIELMKESGHQSHVYDELKTMAELEETYGSKGEGMWRATQLANEAMMYPLEDAGRINFIFKDNSKDTFESLLTHLTPDNMLVVLTAKGVETDKKEHHYQAPYSYTENTEFYQALTSPSPRADFTIAEVNPFIPESASVPNREIKEDILPVSLINSGGTNLYFGVDHEFLRPKGVISFKILFPDDVMTLKHRVYLKLYSACVNESLNELGYPAKQAGLNYSFREGYEGIFLNVSGYSESAMTLYEMILDHMVDFSITEDQFNGIKDRVVRDYQNFSLSDAHQQTREKGADIFNHVKYSWEESLPVAQEATLSDIHDYGNSLYEKTFVEGLVYGDFKESDARRALRIFNEKSNTTDIKRTDAFDLKFLDQSKSEEIQYIGKLSVNNSCFYREYVLGNDTPEMRATALVIGQALQQPFFTEMRTNQQLGYIVWSYTRSRDETYYLSFVIQSGAFTADDVNQRADDFIASTPELLTAMDEETFQQLKESAIEKLEKKPMSISERANKLQTFIFEHDADFQRDQKTIAALETLQQSSTVELLSKTLGTDTRRMVNFLMFAEQHENTTGAKGTFNKLKTWKASRSYK